MALKLENVTKRFQHHVAVDRLNMTVEKGTVFGLLGANGAGKTTTFRMILGLLPPTQGTIAWEGKKISLNMSNKIGYLPEERGLYPKLTVEEQLVYLGKLRGMSKEEAVSELDKWLEKFHIPQYKKKKMEELSKGNQQKIQFIAAVIHQPELLILDEPFSGLDPVNVEILKEAVVKLNKNGTTIVFSSHRMEQVEELCDDICILQKGKTVIQGRLNEIKRQFSKKNVTIRADFPLDFLHTFPGVVKVNMHKEGAKVQITGEDAAKPLLEELVQKGFVRKFEIEEPTLYEIFVEKVGAWDE